MKHEFTQSQLMAVADEVTKAIDPEEDWGWGSAYRLILQARAERDAVIAENVGLKAAHDATLDQEDLNVILIADLRERLRNHDSNLTHASKVCKEHLASISSLLAENLELRRWDLRQAGLSFVPSERIAENERLRTILETYFLKGPNET